MAFSSHRKLFKGTLANVPVELLKQLDFKKETLAERKEFINKKYGMVSDFYNLFIFGTKEEEYYKPNLNKDDDLSAEINIFKFCERDASFLLNSKDIPMSKQQEYRILSEEEFRALEKREISLSSFITTEQEDEDVLTIIEPKKSNDYTNMEHKILSKDLEDERTKQVLGEYEKFRQYLKQEMEKLKKKEFSELNLYQIKTLLKDINDDMIKSKIILRGIRNPAKRLGDESGMFYTEVIDYADEKVIKQVLRLVKFGELDPDSDLSHIAYDMEVAIKKLYINKQLDELDLEIIECYNSGYTERAIALELDKAKTTINQRLNKIFKKIAIFYKKS